MEYINQTSSTNKNLASEDLALSLCTSALRSDATSSSFLKLSSTCWTRDPIISIIWSLFVFNRSNLTPRLSFLGKFWKHQPGILAPNTVQLNYEAYTKKHNHLLVYIIDASFSRFKHDITLLDIVGFSSSYSTLLVLSILDLVELRAW